MDKKTAIFMSMGFEIVGVIVFAIYAGRWLDNRYGLGGLGMAGMIGVGFAGWMAHVILIARQLQRDAASTGGSSGASSGGSSDGSKGP